MKQTPRVALAYDRLNSNGGAEKVLIELQKLYPEAPIFTSVYDAERTPWLLPQTKVIPSWLQRIPWARRHHQWFGWLMPLLFESFDLSDYDLLISVSSEAAKGMKTSSQQLHINYTLTPTRYLWSHSHAYAQQLPVLVQPVFFIVQWFLRHWDYQAAQRPDVMIPISELVGERIKKYYDREPAAVIYPPIPELPESSAPKKAKTVPKKFFFTWGRHVRYKQFDMVIQAAVQTQYPVIIAGEGKDTPRLQALAKKIDPQQKLIIFVGRISDQELVWYLEHATGAVFPQQEDFGIVIIESLLAGCPAIVQEKSGAAELMTAKDGILLTEISTQIVADAMQKIMSQTWKRLDIQQRARQYAGARFTREWNRYVQKAWKEHVRTLHQKSERNL